MRDAVRIIVLCASLGLLVTSLIVSIRFTSFGVHSTSPYLIGFFALTAFYCWLVDALARDPEALGTGLVVCGATAFLTLLAIGQLAHVVDFKKGGGDQWIANIDHPGDLTPLEFHAGLNPPRVISKTDAEFDDKALALRARGINVLGPVGIEATIDIDGTAKDMRFSGGAPDLGPAAIEAVRSWRFEPATRDGKPVPAAVELSVHFAGDDGTLPAVRARTQAAADRTPPRVVLRTEPELTDAAKRAHITGVVLIEANVDIYGHVTSTRVLRGLGKGLDERAAAAVKRWEFAPATLDGHQVAALINVEVEFKD